MLRQFACYLGIVSAASACVSIEDEQVADEVVGEQALVSPERVVRSALGGAADLDLQFSEFFNSWFTMSVWFQPEFVLAHEGPILAENGSGKFMIGMDQPEGGVPTLLLQVGQKSAEFYVPDLEPRQWRHLAVRRGPTTIPTGAYTFTVYLDGVKLTPVSGTDISFSSSDPMTSVPSGNVRIGRRTQRASDAYWQFYGLVDEVAVYQGNPLISPLAAEREVVEYTSLIKGFTFDTVIQTNPKLAHGVTYTAPTVAVAQPLLIGTSIFDMAAYMSPTETTYRLPFAAGQAWRVMQGYENNTHHGTAAFCLDMNRVGVTTQGTSLYAVADGDVVRIRDSSDDEDPWSPPASGDYNLPWRVMFETGTNEQFSYLHLQESSVETALCTGANCVPHPDVNNPIAISVGDNVGKVGTAVPSSNSHLHFGMRTIEGTTATAPMAFSDYQICDLDPGETVTTSADLSKCSWRDVTRGMLRKGDIVRR